MVRRPTQPTAILVAGATLLLAACSGGNGKTTSSPSGKLRPAPSVRTRLAITEAGFSLAAPIQREVAVLSNGTIYLAGGLDSSYQSVPGVFALNSSTGAIAHLGDLPNPFHDAAGAVIEDHLVVFGGGPGTGTNLVQAFDPTRHTGAVIGHLPVTLSDVTSATVAGTVFLVGGFDQVSPRREIYATVDAAHFRVTARLPTGLRYTAVAAVGTDLVIAGGVSSSGPVSTVFVLDTRTNRLSLVGNLPERVGHAVAFSLGSLVYVVGGQDAGGRAVRPVFAIDLVRRKVSAAGSLRFPLSDAAAVSDGATAWVLGGWRGAPVAQILRATLTPAPKS